MGTFFDLTRNNLSDLCHSLAVSDLHAKNLFRAAYKQQRSKPWLEHQCPVILREYFDASCEPESLDFVESHASGYDGSIKFLVGLHDGQKVETVLMPESKRITLCVSTQVGCQQGCTFCHTGRMGLKRNLTAGEIVGQVALANRWLMQHPEWLSSVRLPVFQRISNVVFMGMGEPLDNVPSVAQALSILTDPYGPAIAMRRISVSTAGHLDGLRQLLAIHPDVRLAISVHSPYDRERSRIMPINRRWPLSEVLSFLRENSRVQTNGLLLQYTLISGVNDSVADAKALVELVRGLNVKINLIPLNEVGPSRLKCSRSEDIERFKDVIYRSGVRVMVRYSKGQDIAAACGQLVV